MKRIFNPRTLSLWTTLACGLAPAANAATILVNGGFESGFAGWTRLDQIGSDGQFALQSGTTSPVNGFLVPPPPEGTNAAMTDAQGPGSHLLYQDFVVPSLVPNATLNFSLFIKNGATAFVAPSTLDFATPALNQQARVDIIRTSVDPFSIAAADILLNLYQTQPNAPLTSGYTASLTDITALLQANPGQTLRLRFSEVDNVAPFNLGVDSVSLDIGTTPIPEPATYLLTCGALLVIGLARRRSRSM